LTLALDFAIPSANTTGDTPARSSSSNGVFVTFTLVLVNLVLLLVLILEGPDGGRRRAERAVM
jgi:hypothetical protein